MPVTFAVSVIISSPFALYFHMETSLLVWSISYRHIFGLTIKVHEELKIKLAESFSVILVEDKLEH
jgi:hypothetical protein